MDFWQIVREFGLPLAMLAFVIGAIASGLYVAGRELKDRKLEWSDRDAEREKDWADRLLYVEARRAEEREGRIKAEDQLARVSETTGKSIASMMDLLSDIEKEVIRGNPRGGPPSA